jgi:hypothetical protein
MDLRIGETREVVPARGSAQWRHELGGHQLVTVGSLSYECPTLVHTMKYFMFKTQQEPSDLM